jgi:hypothetical protein
LTASGEPLRANRVVAVPRLLLAWRVVRGWRSDNPALRPGRLRAGPGYTTWTPARCIGIRIMFRGGLMARRAGSADLPLHNGRVPAWLGQRMARLGAVITQAIVHHYGREEFLRRLAHPFWFQSFGAVMGMDWHSSGITTSVIGALKRGLGPLSSELGIHVCGGRGSHSRQTPQELVAIGERTGFDGAALARASRLVAKVDSAAVQDGFDLYLHGFIVTDDGKWVVVQQGMNGATGLARRYHWLSEDLRSFVEAPHAAIDGKNQGQIVNLTDNRAAASRRGQLDLLRDFGPDRIAREVAALEGKGAPSASDTPLLPHLIMPSHHEVRPKDVMIRRLHGALAAAAERGPSDFAELLPDRALAGHGGGSGPWRALPVRGSSAFFAGSWRQGPSSLSGADHRL